MVEALCIEKIRDKNGVIKEYVLRDTQGVENRFEPNFLKNLILTNQINVVNLKLTSDGRLIDCTPSEKEGVQVMEDIQSELAMLKLLKASCPNLNSDIIDFDKSRSGKAWVLNIIDGKMENFGTGNIKAKEQNIDKLIFTIKVDRKTLHQGNSSMMVDYTVETFSTVDGRDTKTDFNNYLDLTMNKILDNIERKIYLNNESSVASMNLSLNLSNSKVLACNNYADILYHINNVSIGSDILIIIKNIIMQLIIVFNMGIKNGLHITKGCNILNEREIISYEKGIKGTRYKERKTDEIIQTHGSSIKGTTRKEKLEGIGYEGTLKTFVNLFKR